MAILNRYSDISRYKVGDYFYNFNGGKCHIVSFSTDGDTPLVIFKHFLKSRGWTYFAEETEYLHFRIFNKPIKK